MDQARDTLGQALAAVELAVDALEAVVNRDAGYDELYALRDKVQSAWRAYADSLGAPLAPNCQQVDAALRAYVAESHHDMHGRPNTPGADLAHCNARYEGQDCCLDAEHEDYARLVDSVTRRLSAQQVAYGHSPRDRLDDVVSKK